MPKISVIIPTYNRAALLVQAVESVLAQTFQDLEIIIADNGSSDNTAQVVSLYDNRVHYISLVASGLPAVARNAGLRVAKGQYIAFLDSDDQWLPHKLERQVSILDKQPGIGLVCSNALRLTDGEADPTGQLYLRHEQGKNGWVLKVLLKDNFVITSTAMVRRALLERVGLFGEDSLLRVADDYDLWLRFAALSEFYYIREALAVYRDQPEISVRSQQSRVAYWQGMLIILERLQQHLKNFGYQDQLTDEVIDNQAYTYCYQILNAHRAAAQYGAASKCALRMFQQRPMKTLRDGLGHGYRSIRQRLRFRQGNRDDSGTENKKDGSEIKLHLGCGEVYLPSYLNIDFPPAEHTVQKTSKADLYADITQLSYPWESVAEIRLHHVFEHFDRATAFRLLIQWYLWLDEGGKLVIETPDFERSVRKTRSSFCSARQRMVLIRHIFGSQEANWAVHKDAWYPEKFKLYLSNLGFHHLQFSRSEWRGTFNVTVVAFKEKPFMSLEDLMRATEQLLRLSLVDDSESEQRLLQVWLQEMKKVQVTAAKTVAKQL